MTKTRTLDDLEGRRVGTFTLVPADFAPSRFSNQREFVLYLQRRGIRSESPIFRGTFSAAVAALNLTSWIDGEFIEQTRIAGTLVKLWNEEFNDGAALGVMKALGDKIPAGGRIWLAYERYGDEGASILETRHGLQAQVPPLATPMGFLLWAADCWLGVRDWHFPEGGREGTGRPREGGGPAARDVPVPRVEGEARRHPLRRGAARGEAAREDDAGPVQRLDRPAQMAEAVGPAPRSLRARSDTDGNGQKTSPLRTADPRRVGRGGSGQGTRKSGHAFGQR